MARKFMPTAGVYEVSKWINSNKSGLLRIFNLPYVRRIVSITAVLPGTKQMQLNKTVFQVGIRVLNFY